eukprot:gnl/Dysnectes_brevis/7480_a12576_307.p1 GENE.gnl/Dysnectes_brevis/7480_a12576_307~~gnl/Dysnectes_brevis/7480_a12576_307.p1  ORF type:complete len:267 (+),score=72.82 gnl/Dysnectes_brevis/7480_a12576_307:47-802(+)
MSDLPPDLLNSPLAKPHPRKDVRHKISPSPRMRPSPTVPMDPHIHSVSSDPEEREQRRELHTIQARIQRSQHLTQTFQQRQHVKQRMQHRRKEQQVREQHIKEADSRRWRSKLSKNPLSKDLVAEFQRVDEDIRFRERQTLRKQHAQRQAELQARRELAAAAAEAVLAEQQSRRKPPRRKRKKKKKPARGEANDGPEVEELRRKEELRQHRADLAELARQKLAIAHLKDQRRREDLARAVGRPTSNEEWHL